MKVVLEKCPATIEEFNAMDQMDLTKPENTCAMFICALNLFVENKELGVEAINILKGPVDLNQHEISFLRDRLMDKPYLPLAYFEGAKPDNQYQPELPLTIKFYEDQRPQDSEPGFMKLYLQTSGADSKRAIILRQKGDEWFIYQYPGIVMDIRKPSELDPWA